MGGAPVLFTVDVGSFALDVYAPLNEPVPAPQSGAVEATATRATAHRVARDVADGQLI